MNHANNWHLRRAKKYAVQVQSIGLRFSQIGLPPNSLSVMLTRGTDNEVHSFMEIDFDIESVQRLHNMATEFLSRQKGTK